MRKEIIILTIVTICQWTFGVTDPFEQGYLMGNLGTIIQENGTGGRLPWTPSAFCSDTSGAGVSFATVSYYDDMDGPSIYRTSAGLRLSFNHLILKTAFSYYNALKIYTEETGYISAGTGLLRFLRFSLEIRGTRMAVNVSSDQHSRTNGEIGASIWVPFRFASISMNADHILIKSGGYDGTDHRICFSLGAHTNENRFGAQGISIDFMPSETGHFRMRVGEELRFGRWFAFHIAISGNPVMVGAGVVVNWKKTDVNVAVVNHPVLGWSKGLSLDFNTK
jgi:hypothetical protein